MIIQSYIVQSWVKCFVKLHSISPQTWYTTFAKISCFKTCNLSTDSFYDWFRGRSKKTSNLRAFVLGIHRWPVNSPHKRPVTRKMFLFDDVIMVTSNSIPKRKVTPGVPNPRNAAAINPPRLKRHSGPFRASRRRVEGMGSAASLSSCIESRRLLIQWIIWIWFAFYIQCCYDVHVAGTNQCYQQIIWTRITLGWSQFASS